MFTRTSLISRKPKTSAFKYMTMFFLGASAVMLATQALQINTMVTNSIQYIGKTIMTAGGANAGPETIVLDGSGGNAFFSGNVGIGISGATEKLEVDGTGSFKGVCISGDCRAIWPTGIAGESLWSSGGNDAIYYNTGNVGIGIAAPTEKFQIGTYAWIGKDASTLSSTTGGSFLRLYGSHMGSSLINPPKETPNIQLNYATKFTQQDPWSYSNWMIDNAAGSLSFTYATGDYNYATNMVINPIGNVGIGTTSPQAKLDIVSDNFDENSGYSAKIGASAHNGLFLQSDIVSTGYAFVINTTRIGFRIAPAQGIGGTATTSGTLRGGPSLFIGTGGDVGINNRTSLGAKLSIDGDTLDKVGLAINTKGNRNTGAEQIRLYNTQTSNAFRGISSAFDGSFRIARNGSVSNGIYISTGGKVGLGTTNPLVKLELSGAVKIGDDIGITPQAPCPGYGGTLVYHDGYFYVCETDSLNPPNLVRKHIFGSA